MKRKSLPLTDEQIGELVAEAMKRAIRQCMNNAVDRILEADYEMRRTMAEAQIDMIRAAEEDLEQMVKDARPPD